MNYNDLANLLYPDVTKTIDDLEKMYPERNLPEGAQVMRFAPSPTGRMHLGNLYASFIPEVISNQTNGVFIVRMEDTDQKRSIDNGVNLIIKDLKDFNIKFDEGMISETEWNGEYGPYIQSERREIYWAFAKYLIENDMAYPCFCTEDDLNEIRQKQEKYKSRIGY